MATCLDEQALEGSSDGGAGLLNLVLSLFLSGGKMAFVWDVVAEVCSCIPGPLVRQSCSCCAGKTSI